MAKYKPKYVKVTNPKAPASYKIGKYTSRYGDQLDSALNTVVNWNYNPMEDANYQALAKIYGARGNIAAKDTLADAASLNGGYGTSYAVSAAQQARNQYNQELAALIPELEQSAYTRAQGTLGALRDADETDYGRWRDTEGDRQWLYSQNYQRYQDAIDQYRWALDYNNSIYQMKHSGGGGGGGRRGGSGGGGGGYSTPSSSSGGSTPTYGSAQTSTIQSPGSSGGTYGVKQLTTVKEKDKKSGGRVVK